MYYRICILIGKIVILLAKLFKRGSVLPGKIVLKLNKNMLKHFKLPKTVIAVTGSSGKGSCSSVIAKIFRDQGYTVAHNISGSNLTTGITTLLLNRCKINGKIKDDVLVLEVDERYTKYIFEDIKPGIVVITNVTRDQPPRQGHFDFVLKEIQKALTNDMTLVINGDEPYLRKFNSNKIVYYGIEKDKYAYMENKFENLNINYCPKCGKKLEYNYYHIETCGDYYCTSCDFKRPKIDFSATKIDYDKSIITINNKYEMKSPYNMLFGIYNMLACFTVTSICKLDEKKALETIASLEANKKLFKTFDYKNRKVTILNNKNENSSTFNQSLWYLNRDTEKKSIIIGWKEISRRYEYDDLSWLYDINFELLNDKSVDKIVCCGIHAYDIAVRLKLACIDTNKIITIIELKDAVEYLKEKTKGNIYAVVNFDYVLPFNEYMNGSENK